ncbi:F-box domain [Arabidopsis suecica]|uniref:F-box domain n=1 Tax=Arabidopsis suecica TaxID=45249 RepID=A0A8T2BDM4_ARASU|nr:F-box domain [Arabidopsis suecica]
MLNHPRTWSELSSDLLESIFEKLSFADFHRAKLVCSTWNSTSKRTVSRKSEPPWLILFPDSEENVCLLFNPEEDRIYTTERDFSKIRFLANSGKWFLVVDSGFSLCIIDVFNENRRIDLPPLESLLSSKYSLKRVRDKEFRWGLTSGSCLEMKTDNLRGLLWVDEKTVDSVGDEALLLDLGIILPANHTIGIKPNTIYFTRHDRARLRIPFDLDICVFNLAINTLKRFPQLAGLNLKDARWFLPFT